MTWYVRRASLHDKPELEALCRTTVGPDDYALDYLERSILKGIVYVALDGKQRIVGMMSYRPCIDGSGWLHMARTHPDVQRQGVARALAESFVGMARASNVPFLRLWADATNVPSLNAAKAGGFHEVARFTRVVGPAARGTPKSAPRRFDEELWRTVHGSTILARGKGYAAHEWTFVPATRPVVFAVAAKGHFHGWDGNLLTFGQAEGEAALEFTMWAGRPDELFAEGCRRAAHEGRKTAEAFVPHDRDLLAGARRTGFEPGSWGPEAVLFELAVPSAHLRKRTRKTYAELAAERAGSGHTHGQGDALGWARWNP